LLEGIVADPDQRIGLLPLLTQAERQQILVEWNTTEADYPKDACIHELFEKQAALSPEAIAVTFEDQDLTYRELNLQANQLAHYLGRHGVGPDVLVGICMGRSLKMVIGILGILKAGGAYLPLNPDYPQERLRFMLEDAAAPVLLTQVSLVEKLPASNRHVLCLDRDWAVVEKENDSNPALDVSAANLAYVNYTSGSTGTPKGVEVLHRGITRLLFGVRYADFGARHTFLQLSEVSFDASTFELWGALLHGARCVLFPERMPTADALARAIGAHGIDTLWLTTSLFNALVDERPEVISSIRQLLIGGEALSVKHVKRALELLPTTEIVNGYGPTEATTFTCCYPIPRDLSDSAGSIPIGRPIGNTEVYVLDRNQQPVPVGVPGELYIGGAGLARGYLHRPELTAEKFVAHPFSQKAGARLYRTGDVVRWLADGNLDFLGRTDDQVKIRGYRIELGEIESVLAGHLQVKQAAVVAREDARGEKRLVAYAVPTGEPPPSFKDLCGYLKQSLPDYMVPSAFVSLDRLPLTPSGKVDRQALPAPDMDRLEAPLTYEAARSPIEELVAKIWSEVLGVERVGIRDNFFDLGGHSLLATRMMARVRHTFEVDLPLRSLFDAPTVEGVALAIVQCMSMKEKTEFDDLFSETREES
jgi:amino acid adenylation domain-containing protein